MADDDHLGAQGDHPGTKVRKMLIVVRTSTLAGVTTTL
jgi:hypothetical protein